MAEYEYDNRMYYLFFSMLLLTDVIFIFINIFFYIYDIRFKNILTSMLNLEQDLSIPEFFQYNKFLWSAFICLLLSFRRNYVLFFLISFDFIILLVDDAMSLHEKIGKVLSKQFHVVPIAGLRLQDYGEVVFSMVTAYFVFLLLTVAYIFSNKQVRSQILNIGLLVIVLGFFGVVIDTLHVIVSANGQSNAVGFALAVIEDGGEMIVATIMLSYVFKIYEYERSNRGYS